MASNGDTVRVLHWVFKVGDLKKSIEFYSQVFGLHVLRHEEFSTGCEATCNGPYEGSWSKTMVGYGVEKENFVLELTYNYGVSSYERGNDLRYIALKANPTGENPFEPFQAQVMKDRATKLGYKVFDEDGFSFIVGPDDVTYKLVPSTNPEPFLFVSLNVSNLEKSKDYWANVLGLKVYENVAGQSKGKSAVVGISENMCKLELVETEGQVPIDHKKAFGRIAFSTRNGPKGYFDAVTKTNDKVINTPISLKTPGKADVEVTILADRDGYEICFVGELGFDDLSTLKPGFDFINWEERETMINAVDRWAKRKAATN
eukprot:TRINITY_DN8902_c0_g1_i1.p1 TRINITY_DN8902_c0_g1~~TRINITY_DN8902_c0_g1_i1.p1  ORF type:complete len:316 (-),score=80.03 TRINITY_DN8902_c0_g1_i1:66-1013(-)